MKFISTPIEAILGGALFGIGMILGIDAILDMARTSVNVVGNCLASAVVARWEGVDLNKGPEPIADPAAR